MKKLTNVIFVLLLCICAAAPAVILTAVHIIEGDSLFRALPLQGDPYYDAPCPQAGNIARLDYSTLVYDYDGNRLAAQEKYCYVYTPYGYAPERPYDILYLLHGGGENAEMWMTDSRFACVKNAVDRMIADGAIKPVIIVMPSFNFYNDCEHELNRHTARKDSGEADYIEVARIFKYELHELVPAVESVYSTYAGDEISESSLTAGRDHRAFAGISRGSITTLKSAVCGRLDWFSSFGVLSGTDMTAAQLLAAVDRSFSNYKINKMFFACGTLDHCYAETKKLYEGLRASGRFTNENLRLAILHYQTHYDFQWPVDLFNLLLFLFA